MNQIGVMHLMTDIVMTEIGRDVPDTILAMTRGEDEVLVLSLLYPSNLLYFQYKHVIYLFFLIQNKMA